MWLRHWPRAETAETIFINGNVYTVNEKQPHAEAIAVKGGSNRFRRLKRGREKIPERQNAHGRSCAAKPWCPGFTDSHCHIFGIGEREMSLNLEGTNTPRRFSRESEGARRQNRARQMDHRPRLDRNVLETAAISDAR